MKVTHLNMSGDWQEPSVVLHLDPPKKLPECSHSMVAGFPQSKGSKRPRWKCDKTKSD